MTVRSVLLGIIGAAAICAVTFFNDFVVRGTFLIGNFMPVGVFGPLLLLVLVANPLLRRAARRAALTGQELAVAVAVVFFACYVPGRGLMHYFTNVLMLPRHQARLNPAWQSEPTRLAVADVDDAGLLARSLCQAASSPADASPVLAAVVQRLPGSVLERLRTLSAGDDPAPETTLALVEVLNAVIAGPLLAGGGGNEEHLGLPAYARRLLRTPPGSLSDEDVAMANRALLDSALPAALDPFRPGVLEHVPEPMLAGTRSDTSDVLDGFVTGLGEGDKAIGLHDVPWRAWRPALCFWLPLLLAMCLTVIGLALVIHRQWASHEHLPYPTVEFAHSLLPAADGRAGPVLRSRSFWGAMAAVTAIHMNNYAAVWWPDYLVPFKLQFHFTPLLEIFPTFGRGPWWQILNPRVLFTVVGFGYFLATDVSLSLGVAPYLYCLAVGICAGYGITFGGSHLEASLGSGLYAGAYVSMFLVIAYTGRYYYSSVFRRGLGLKSGDAVEPHALWGFRLFLVGLVLFVLQLCRVGVDWQLGLLYSLGTVMIFVVVSRLLVEAGVFYLHPYCYPCAVLYGFLGASAVNPDQLLVLSMVSAVLLIDPREALMAFAMCSVRLADRARCRVGPTVAWGSIALLVGFAVAVPVTLYLQYQHGALTAGDGWSAQMVPSFPFKVSSSLRQTLEAQGSLDASLRVSGWGHFVGMVPDRPMVTGFGITFGLVLLFSFCRHRFAKWPLHPLLFLVLGTWQSQTLAFSYLIGCVVKACVTKYGGAVAYHRFKPVMVGLVAGDMLSGVVTLVIGAGYYFIQGQPPMGYRVLPV